MGNWITSYHQDKYGGQVWCHTWKNMGGTIFLPGVREADVYHQIRRSCWWVLKFGLCHFLDGVRELIYISKSGRRSCWWVLKYGMYHFLAVGRGSWSTSANQEVICWWVLKYGMYHFLDGGRGVWCTSSNLLMGVTIWAVPFSSCGWGKVILMIFSILMISWVWTSKKKI